MLCMMLLFVPLLGAENVATALVEEELEGLLGSPGLGTNYIWLTIQSSKGYNSWQGALMTSFGPYYNASNDRNVCQRYNGTDYPVSQETAKRICNLNNFDVVDSVRKLDYYATWWATKIESGLRALNCTEAGCSSVKV